MVKLCEYQKGAIRDLQAEVIKKLNASASRKVIVFKAPTGSGKTVMVSTAIERLTTQIAQGCDCPYTEVAFIWLAPQKLHIQSYNSMKTFFGETNTVHPLTFDDVDVHAGLRHGDVLFLNWASVNKDNAVIIRDNEQNRNIAQMVTATKLNNVAIVMVIDEEHYYAGDEAKKSQTFIQRINPKIELRISATPKTTSMDGYISVDREDVINEGMIKKKVELNPNIKTSTEQVQETVDIRLLDIALNQRNQLQSMYLAAGLSINPLLLIQLPNDSKEKLIGDEEKMVEQIEDHLRDLGICVENGKLGIWLSERHEFDEEHISDNENHTEVLIFKQAIALGWDCPRASVLLVFREWKSMTFSTQVVGRVCRMPERRHYTNEALNYGYVFTNLTQKYFDIKADEADYITTIHSHKREGLESVQLDSVYLDHPRPRNRLGADYRQVLIAEFEKYFKFNPNELFDPDDFDTIEDIQTKSKTEIDDTFSYNRKLAREKGIQTDVTRIFVDIPKDIELPDEVGVVKVVEQARLAVNNAELNNLMLRFCRKKISSFAPYDSIPVLKGALLYCLDKFLGLKHFEAIKVILYNQNKSKFEHIIEDSFERYKARIKTKDRMAEQAEYHFTKWQIPETLAFNTKTHQAIEDYRKHYLLPFFEELNVSNPEKAFSPILECEDSVEWWYKNGDNGQENFAIPYTNIDGKESCFYVDYIIKLKNGVVCLFDTKTQGSDVNGAVKNNALLKYIEEQNKTGKIKLVGGLLIKRPNTNNWYYPTSNIQNTKDIDAWKLLDFNELNRLKINQPEVHYHIHANNVHIDTNIENVQEYK